MNSFLVVALVISITVSIISSIIVLIPYLQKKGINVQDLLSKADMVLDGADKAVQIAQTIVPANPVVNIVAEVEKYAHIGVNQAEQLYIASQLGKDDRNAKAKETIYAALKVANIEVTPEIEKIIDGVIEAECLAVGHSTPEEKIMVTKLNNEKVQLQSALDSQVQTVQSLQAQIGDKDLLNKQIEDLQAQVNKQNELAQQLEKVQLERDEYKTDLDAIRKALGQIPVVTEIPAPQEVVAEVQGQ